MAAPFATSDRLFDYGGPQPYGASPVCTPFADAWVEMEWQKTQHALGRPVDLAAIFEAVGGVLESAEERIETAEQAAEDCCDAVRRANKEINEIRTAFAEEILGRLNKIDRHVVSKFVKDQLNRLAAIHDSLAGVLE